MRPERRTRLEASYETPAPVSAQGAILAGEVWHSVNENGAAVSSMGRFRNSLGHMYVPAPSRQVYARVWVAGRTRSLHRLVAEAFDLPGRSSSRCQVNHKNGVAWDNRLDNLEWASASQNVRHSHATNAARADGRAYRSRPVWVRHVRGEGTSDAWAFYPSVKDAATALSVSESSLRKCARGVQKFAHATPRAATSGP